MHLTREKVNDGSQLTSNQETFRISVLAPASLAIEVTWTRYTAYPFPSQQ